MLIIKGTNPAIILEIDMDMTGNEYIVSLKSGRNSLTKTNNQCQTIIEQGKTIIMVPLTQSETLCMKDNRCKIMVNFIDNSGNRTATDKAEIALEENLYTGVMEYGQ